LWSASSATERGTTTPRQPLSDSPRNTASPLLIVLCNNRQYASQTRNLHKYYPDSTAVREQNFVGNVIEPTPDYVKQAEAYGGTGERVQKSDELRPALQRALEAVISGQTFLLDVIVYP